MALDNVLWGAQSPTRRTRNRQTLVLRALNTKIQADPRVSSLLLPVGDGLTLARKR